MFSYVLPLKHDINKVVTMKTIDISLPVPIYSMRSAISIILMKCINDLAEFNLKKNAAN